MALNAGARIGPYEIIAALGAGGMGEVYRARDPKLNREVAIKIVPESLASDPVALARFQTEAQAVAALSHPNILGIFDFGTDGTLPYAVMELLDGRSLREVLSDGPLSPRKAIDVGAQLAAGLAAAHARGITHRDLKPENVFVTRDGRAKILDFGLAKVDVPQGAAGSFAATVSPTSPGTVLGTVGYMSPEQVRGLPVDPRADIFSLGAILYEALSGRRAFSGPSAVETMSAILKDDPPELTRTNAAIPPALDRIVQRALEKNPEERFQSARDFGFALEAMSGSAMSAPANALEGAADRAPRRWLRPVLAVAALAAAVAVGAIAARIAAAPEVAPAQITFETKTFDPQTIFNARFLPEAGTIVFSAALEGNASQLFVSRAGAVAPQPLGVPRTHLLSVSSRGELAVLTGVTFLGHRLFRGTLARMPIDGTPRPWLQNVREADWSPDGSTLAVIRDAGRTDRLEYPIGTLLYEVSGYLSDVRVSPDGTRVAFMEHPVRFDDRGWVKVVDMTGTVHTLAGEYWGQEGVAWTRDGGTILYSAALGGFEAYQLHAVNANGAPAPRVVLPSPGAMFILDTAPDGRWLVTRNDDHRSLRALLPGDTEEREFSWLGSPTEPTLSGDARLLMFTDESQSAGANYAVNVRTVDGSPPVRLGEGNALDMTRDGTRVLAQLYNPDRALVVYPTGTGEPLRLNLGTLQGVQGRRFFPDGQRVVLCGTEPGKAFRCYHQDLSGGLPQPLTPEGFDTGPITADGRQIVLIAPDQAYSILSIPDGAIHPAAGTVADDIPAAWTADGSSLIVEKQGRTPARLERVNVTTGTRTILREVDIDDRAGLLLQQDFNVLDDGRAYAYAYWRRVSRLFVVRGAGS